MSNKSFLTVDGLGPEVLNHLVGRALMLDSLIGGQPGVLSGKYVGLYFRKSSTRTRTAFTVGAMRLGAQVIPYGPDDLQLITGETPADTGRVLSQFLEILVVRTNQALAEMEEFAAQGQMSVINAMSENEHPTQAIADLVTIYESFGRLEGIHVLYIGEGNNTAAALALAISQLPGMRLTLVTPAGYGLPDSLLEVCLRSSRTYEGSVEQHHRMDKLPRHVDVVYTARWLTMGVPKPDANWLQQFSPYCITPQVMAAVSKPETVFLHDLPAMRGYEVTDDVLDGARSLAFRQAHHKQSSAMAILEWCAAIEPAIFTASPAVAVTRVESAY